MHLFTNWGESFRQHDHAFERQAFLEAGAAIQIEVGVVTAEVGLAMDPERLALVEGEEVVEPGTSSYSLVSSFQDKIAAIEL